MFESGLLKDRRILITGGGTGLGRSMAICFGKLGASVFLIGRREAPLAETCKEIRSGGAPAAYACCDVRDFGAVGDAIAAAENQLGTVDTLVNNAAGNFIARTEKLSPNAFNAVVGVVLQGTFYSRSRWEGNGSQSDGRGTSSISQPHMQRWVPARDSWSHLRAPKQECWQ